MEANKLYITFAKEMVEVTIDMLTPDFEELIDKIILKNIDVIESNISVDTLDEKFDRVEFVKILIKVYKAYTSEIQAFFKGIKTELSTYYNQESIDSEIIKHINEKYTLNDEKTKEILENIE